MRRHVIVLCVIVLVAGRPQVVRRARFGCDDTERIRAFFETLGSLQVVVEATAAYEWFFLLIENLGDRVVLAHPKKLRVIAESTRKSDKIDAEVLAVFLALDMIAQAHRPSPRVRQHRVLVRHRCWLQRRITSLKSKIRNVLGHDNADVAGLFIRQGAEYLETVPLPPADRVRVNGGAALNSFVMATAACPLIPNRWLSPHPLVDAPTLKQHRRELKFTG